MCESEFLLMGLGLVAAHSTLKKRRKTKSKWCKDWLRRRDLKSHVFLMEELRFEPQDWLNYLRMDEKTYDQLLSCVTPYIKRQDTNMREAVSPHQRLSATLRFLATGQSYEDLKFHTRISPHLLGKIIPETCSAIINMLMEDYMKVSKQTCNFYFHFIITIK